MKRKRIKMGLNNKVALITGGSKGIGYAVAASMLKEGMRVAITSRHREEINEAASRLSMNGGEVLPLVCDVRNAQAQEIAVKTIMDKWGQLDVLIANAGVGHFASISEMTHDQWNEVMDINLTGVFNSVKACLDPIKASKGYIFTVASLAGTNFFPRGTAYNASKFGLVGFTQALMMDVRDAGVKVTTLMPGSVATHFNSRTPGPEDAWKIQPEDLGQMVIDLLKMPARTLPSKVEIRPSVPKKS